MTKLMKKVLACCWDQFHRTGPWWWWALPKSTQQQRPTKRCITVNVSRVVVVAKFCVDRSIKRWRHFGRRPFLSSSSATPSMVKFNFVCLWHDLISNLNKKNLTSRFIGFLHYTYHAYSYVCPCQTYPKQPYHQALVVVKQLARMPFAPEGVGFITDSAYFFSTWTCISHFCTRWCHNREKKITLIITRGYK